MIQVPPLGSDVEAFVKKSSGIQSGYVKAWENSLRSMDQELRTRTTLSAFQLLVSNASTIHLSDSPEAKRKDSPFAMARLIADISARQSAVLMRMSVQTIRL